MPIHKCYTCKYETVADDAARCPKCGTKDHDFPAAWKLYGYGIIMFIVAGAIGSGFIGIIFAILGLIGVGAGLFRPLIREWASKRIE